MPGETEGRKERWTQFHRTLLVTAGGPKKKKKHSKIVSLAKSKLNYKDKKWKNNAFIKMCSG